MLRISKQHRVATLWILIVVLVIALSALAYERGKAADVSLFISCIENPSESGSPRVYFGYRAGEVLEGTSYVSPNPHIGIIGIPPNTLQAGTHERVFGLEVVTPGIPAVWQFIIPTGQYWERSANGEEGAPDCRAGTGQPDGGIHEITLAVGGAPGDCFTWTIQDDYGHWSAVNGSTPYQDEGGGGFTRLPLGGDNTIHDPARYRVFPAPCPP